MRIDSADVLASGAGKGGAAGVKYRARKAAKAQGLKSERGINNRAAKIALGTRSGRALAGAIVRGSTIGQTGKKTARRASAKRAAATRATNKAKAARKAKRTAPPVKKTAKKKAKR